MEKFFTKEKIKILDSYIEYIKSELDLPVGERIGTIDKAHLDTAKALKRELVKNNRSEIEFEGNPNSNSVFTNKYENPISVQFELTSKCNQSCIQCYNQSGNEKNIQNKDLTLEDWIKVARDLAEVPIKQVIISGGEPTLLGDDLFKIMDIFHDVGCQFIFITNGMKINKKNIHKYAKYNYAWMQFSIDGATESVHDTIRGAKGAFKKVVTVAVLARSAGIPVAIASTIMKQNFHQIDEIIDLAYHLGAFKILLGEFMYAGRAVLCEKDISLKDDDIVLIKKSVVKKAMQYANLFQVIKPVDPALSLRYRIAAVSTGMLIRPDGEVRIDCQAPARIGNVKEDSILNIWKNVGYKGWSQPALLDYISKIKNYKDLSSTYPRTHVDADIDLSINNKN